MKIEGLEKLIERVNLYQRELPSKSEEICKELLNFGVNKAQGKFLTATYDGTNDVVVTSSSKKYKSSVVGYVRATGKSVAFIEFGSGIKYMKPEHPEAVRYWAIRGSFGKGLGKKYTWYYKGDPGSRGRVVSEEDEDSEWAGYVATHGNPANRCLYDSAKEMRLKGKLLVRKVEL